MNHEKCLKDLNGTFSGKHQLLEKKSYVVGIMIINYTKCSYSSLDMRHLVIYYMIIEKFQILCPYLTKSALVEGKAFQIFQLFKRKVLKVHEKYIKTYLLARHEVYCIAII